MSPSMPDRPEQLRVPAPEDTALARSLTRIAAIPANADVLHSALMLVAAMARETVGGADGVSVSLGRDGQLTTVASSDETVLAMDHDQYDTGEGPCISAWKEGHWFHVPSLDEEHRWPAFIPRAEALGINSILSTPLLNTPFTAGSLNIYSRTARAFAARDQELASLFATQASVIVSSAHVDVPAEQALIRLQEALRAREVVALAQGVLMEREGLSVEDAYASLRQFSRRSNVPLRERAEQIVASAGRDAGSHG